jgi:hypothetical protein
MAAGRRLADISPPRAADQQENLNSDVQPFRRSTLLSHLL